MIAERRIKSGEATNRRARFSGNRGRKTLRLGRPATLPERDRQNQPQPPGGVTPTEPPTARERTA